MTSRRRSSAGRIAIALTLLVLAVASIAAWRVHREIRARRAPAAPLNVRGAAIDAPVTPKNPAVAPREELPSGGPPPGDGTAVAGHNPNRHAGAKPLAFERAPESEEEYPNVSYDTLASYVYVMPPKRAEGDTTKHLEQIPESIRALHSKKVCVVGYMLPTEWDEDHITEFLLMRNVPQCCFGVAPMMNEWIVVTMDEESNSPEHKLTPTAVEGVLEVGEREVDGWVQSVYRMKAHAILQTE
jgi:hypothetical protein